MPWRDTRAIAPRPEAGDSQARGVDQIPFRRALFDQVFPALGEAQVAGTGRDAIYEGSLPRGTSVALRKLDRDIKAASAIPHVRVALAAQAHAERRSHGQRRDENARGHPTRSRNVK